MNYNPMVKSPATIQAQIDKLVERGCIIEDMKEAKRTLTNINYYRLAYYFALFLEDKHHYRQGTSFEKIMRIYDFDRMLRSLLLSVLEEIEITMRAVISNFHAMKYGALGYLNPSSFDFHHKHQPFLTKIDRMIESNTDEDLVAHHLTKYGGAFPLWLSPVQAKILTITDRSDEMAKALAARLEKEGIRTELDLRNEKIGFKVREAQMMKIPYMLVLGDKEVEQNVVNVRTRKGETIGNMSIDDLVAKLKHEIETKAVD